MATYILTAGVADTLNLFPTLGVEDVVVTPADSAGEADIVDGFETFDRIDISAFSLDAQTLVDEAVAIVGGVRIETPFGTLTLPGITKGQLTVDNFIEAGENGPPIAVDDTATTIAGSEIDITVLANDTDDDPLSLSIDGFSTTEVEGGTVTLNDNGTSDDESDDFLSYSPAAGFTGTDSFSYTITDGEFFDTATVTVTVEENSSPVAEDDSVTVIANEESLIPVLINDSDLNPSDTLSVTDAGGATNGTVTVVDNQVSYTPNAGVTGSDSFMYTITDASGETDTATVTIAIETEGTTLTGDTGDDVLIGSDRETVENIDGGAGDDIIVSGRGSEIITGGDGSDRFVYSSLESATIGGDFILDFDVTSDTVVLDFEISGTPVSSSDVEINTDFISLGFAAIGLNGNPDFVISLNGLAATTNEADIRSRIEFGM